MCGAFCVLPSTPSGQRSMEIVDGLTNPGEPITAFNSCGARALELAAGRGETHVYTIRFEPGGEIGPHPAGFDQLFLVLDGEGWAADADGERKKLARGQAARFSRGETHSKGSESGMTALMIQIERMESGW